MNVSGPEGCGVGQTSTADETAEVAWRDWDRESGETSGGIPIIIVGTMPIYHSLHPTDWSYCTSVATCCDRFHTWMKTTGTVHVLHSPWPPFSLGQMGSPVVSRPWALGTRQVDERAETAPRAEQTAPSESGRNSDMIEAATSERSGSNLIQLGYPMTLDA